MIKEQAKEELEVRRPKRAASMATMTRPAAATRADRCKLEIMMHAAPRRLRAT